MKLGEIHNGLPISIDLAKSHLRVGDLSSDDQLIECKLEMAINIAEDQTNRRIMPYSFTHCGIPENGRIILRDVAEVESVHLPDGSEIDFTVEGGLEKEIKVHTREMVVIKGTVGFSQKTLPGTLKAAILMILATLYDNESDQIVGRTVTQLSLSTEKLLALWRVPPYV